MDLSEIRLEAVRLAMEARRPHETMGDTLHVAAGIADFLRGDGVRLPPSGAVNDRLAQKKLQEALDVRAGLWADIKQMVAERDEAAEANRWQAMVTPDPREAIQRASEYLCACGFKLGALQGDGSRGFTSTFDRDGYFVTFGRSEIQQEEAA